MKTMFQATLVTMLLVTTLYASTVYNNYKTEKVKNNIEKDDTSKDLDSDTTLQQENEDNNNEIETEEQKLHKERNRIKQLASRGNSKPIQNKNTSMKSYMDYRKITDKSSLQYKLQQRDDIYTDSEGFRKIENNFVVAVGTYFTQEIGDKLIIELASGTFVQAVVGDIKDNKHTGDMNIQHSIDNSVVEFIVNVNELETIVRKMGDCSYSSTHSFLQGNVISITILNSKE